MTQRHEYDCNGKPVVEHAQHFIVNLPGLFPDNISDAMTD